MTIKDQNEYIYVKSHDDILESKRWIDQILNWSHQYFAGEFEITSSNKIICRLFPKISIELSRVGKIAVVRKSEKDFYLARIIKLEEDLADRVTKVELSYLKNPALKEYFELKRDKDGNILSPAEPTENSTLKAEDFIICKNNEDASPNLNDAQIYLKELDDIRKATNHYIFMTKPRLLVDMPFRPKQSDWQYVLDSWEIGYISIFTLNDGSQIKPSLIHPSLDGLEKYLSLFNHKWSFFRQIYGIKHQRFKKQEQIAKEIEINEIQFNYLQNNRIQARENFLKEMEQKWGWSFTFMKNKLE